MLRNVALKSLRDIRRGFLWWSLGLIGFVALIVSVYPTVHSNPSLNKLAQDYPEALQAFIAFGGAVDYSSAAGYLGIELFSLMVPLLLLVAAIGTGAGTIAGEEERGTLELLLANPVSRTKVVLEKTVALVLEVAGLGLVLWLALWVGALVDGHGHLRRATSPRPRSAPSCSRSPIGAIAVLLGAATGRRTVAIGVTAATAVARVPRQRPGAARPRARGAAEAVAVLPLRCRRPAAANGGARSTSPGRCSSRFRSARRAAGARARGSSLPRRDVAT